MDSSPRSSGAATSVFWLAATGHHNVAPAAPHPLFANGILDVSHPPSIAANSGDVPAQAMVRCFDCGTPRKDKGARRRHTRIVAQFEALCEQARTEPVHLADVRGAIGVSARTLECCCKEYLGVGPSRYLRLRRMRLARRALLAANVGSDTVTEIAMRYGFWELGRFSTTYRDMFGESPSVTLRNKSGDVCSTFR